MQNYGAVDVLGLYTGIFQKRGPVHRDAAEFRVERCAGSAIPRI